MKDVIAFYNFNKEWIDKLVYLLVSILVMVILSVLKKKPVKVVDTLKEKILSQLPLVMLEAEKKYGAGHGAEKLQFVIDFFIWSFDKNGLTLGKTYIEFIKESVENILSTPQKKGE